MINTLGPYALILPTVASIAVGVAAILTVLVALKFRPPAFLWTLWPAVVVLVGALGTWSGGKSVAAALAYVDPWQREVIGAAGAGESLVPVAVGLAFAGAVSAFSGLLLGIAAAIGAGREANASWSASAIAWTTGLAVFLVAPAAAFATGLEPVFPFLIGGVALTGALGIGLAAVRLPEDVEDAPRSAAARPLVLALAVGGVLASALGAAALAQAEAWRASAQVDAEQLGALLASVLRQRDGTLAIGVGASVLVALSGLPAIGSVGTLLPNARGVIGLIGSGLAAFVALTGALVSMSSLLPFTAPSPFEARVRTIPLPNPKGLGGRLEGRCLVVANGDGFAVEGLGQGDCPPTLPAPEPLIALSAATPAASLIARGSDPTELVVLARTPTADGSGVLSTVRVAWVPEAPADAALVFDEATGERLVMPGGATTGLPGEPGGWKAGLASTAGLTVVLVPGSQWTLQDLLTRCAMLPSGTACTIGSASPVSEGVAPTEEPQGRVASSFKAAVAKNQGQIKYCYESALKSDPTVAGRLEVDITVADERVTSAVIASDTTGNRDLGECVAGKIRRWSFVGVPAGTYTYPFVLRPSPGP